jgi:hypothetical protein
MAMVPSIYLNVSAVEDAVARVQRQLSPDVVRIRFRFDDDWTGDPSIFFRVLLSDSAGKEPKLFENAERVRRLLRKELKVDEAGMNSFFNFRTESEQAEMNDPDWA